MNKYKQMDFPEVRWNWIMRNSSESEALSWLYGYTTALFENGIIDYYEAKKLEKIGTKKLQKFWEKRIEEGI